MKVGDIVKLKSGGPPMTVIDINPAGIACSWFVDYKTRKDTFPPDSLEKTEPLSTGATFGRRRKRKSTD